MARSPPITLTSAVVIADRYHLKRQLAAGGMGTVWVAHDDKLTRDVAIKILAQQLASHSELLTRFEREAKAVAQLRSMHVVDVYDFGIHDRLPFIVMELLEGESLRNRLRRKGRMSLRETLIITDQIAKGLKSAHTAGLIHRDLKPSNVFLALKDDIEIVKLLDFGVVKAVDQSGSSDMTASGTLLGTPQYMSPEQVRARRRIDHRSDLWALGVIVFRLLTGINPFRGESVGDAALRICSDELPKLADYSDHLPAALDRFFAKAFARDPADRYQTADEVAAAFRSECAFALSDVSVPVPAAAVSPEALKPPQPGIPPPPDDTPQAPAVGPSVTPPSTSGIAAVPDAVFGPESGTPPSTRQALMAAAAGGEHAAPGGPPVIPPPRPPPAIRLGRSVDREVGLAGAGPEPGPDTGATRPYIEAPVALPVGEKTVPRAPTDATGAERPALAPLLEAAPAAEQPTPSADTTGAQAVATGVPSAAIPGTNIPLPASMESPAPGSTAVGISRLRAQWEQLKPRLVRTPTPIIIGVASAVVVICLTLIFVLMAPDESAESSDETASAGAASEAAETAPAAEDGEVPRLGKWNLRPPSGGIDEPMGIEETTGELLEDEPDGGIDAGPAKPITPRLPLDKRGTTPPVPGKPKEPKQKWF